MTTAGSGSARARVGLTPWRVAFMLWPLVWREWRHHPWRHAVAALSVALGVALAWSVHVINTSALAEFSAAVRSANGEPDAVVRGAPSGFDDAHFDTLAALPGVRQASPVVEVDTYAAAPGAQTAGRPSRLAVRILGLDALAAATLTPDLLPRPADGSPRLALLDPGRAFVNASARERLGLRDGQSISLQSGPRWQTLQVSGSVAAGGTPLVVVDIAAAQALFGMDSRLSRIDLRLAPSHSAQALAARLPAGLRLVPADARLKELESDYRAMGQMIFGVPPDFGGLMQTLAELERTVNAMRPPRGTRRGSESRGSWG